MLTSAARRFIAAALAAGCGACGGGASGPPDAWVGCEAPAYQFVFDSLTLPASLEQANELALDLDIDPQRRPDNRLGEVLASLAARGLDVQGASDDAMTAGRVIHLLAIRTCWWNDAPSIGWQLYLGRRASSGQLEVDPRSPLEAQFNGTLREGWAYAGPGQVTVRLALVTGAPPIEVDLLGARSESAVAETGCTSGRLGGAVLGDDMREKLLPALAAAITDHGAASGWLALLDRGVACTGPSDCPAEASSCRASAERGTARCTCGARSCQGHLAGDGTVTVEELLAHDLTRPLGDPDVDLIDENGYFNPRADGIADSVSLAIGFSCAPATFR